METITFTCETITPMFLSGADGTTPELRPPSIKGALRFWWRAMNGHLGLEDLKKQEDELFGGNEGRSKVLIRVREIEPNKTKIGEDYKLECYNGKFPKPEFEGVAYLYYSTFMQSDKKRAYFKKIKFEVELCSNDIKSIKQVAYIFWLCSNFGGIGSRSRRCAGNICILSVKDEKGCVSKFNFVPNFDVDIDFIEYIETNIKIIKKEFNVVKTSTQTKFCSFSNCEIHILKDYSENSPLSAVNFIGTKFKEFRDRRQPDYNIAKNYLVSGGVTNAIERSALGLPLSFRFGSIYERGFAPEALISIDSENYERSASSLFLSITRTKKLHFITIINFNSELVPEEIGLSISDKTLKKVISEKGHIKKRPKKIAIPNNNIKQDFINTLDNWTI
jgi:CRISPR-associated protein Cmr1